MKRLLWGKHLLFVFPLLILAELLVILTNLLLEVAPFIMALTVGTMVLLVPGIVSLGIGLGARYPDFKAENTAKVATGLGGVVFMTLSALFVAGVILLETTPVYQLFSARIRGTEISMSTWFFMGLSFFLALTLSIFVTWRPMKSGHRQLEGYE
ncbi:MAG: hypothetical protein P8Y00_06010 [Deltaproteobacteria bacterium]